jgi:DNA-directed RNA polymerase subunit F
MKNILVMVAVGVALCCVTVGGLLGAQGRLNYEGTRNIPLLNTLFTPPTPRADPEEKPHSGVRSRVARVAPAPARKRDPMTGDGASGAGMPTPNGFAPGELIDLPKLSASGMTIDEVNAIVEQARKTKIELAKERAELQQLRRDLEVRERDVAARQARVTGLMQQVIDGRATLERAIKDFNARVVELPAEEEAAYAGIARTIAKLVPEAGAELIVDFWQTPGGQAKVVKILAVMPEDRADEILACLDTKRVREILEKRMTVKRMTVKRTGRDKKQKPRPRETRRSR